MIEKWDKVINHLKIISDEEEKVQEHLDLLMEELHHLTHTLREIIRGSGEKANE